MIVQDMTQAQRDEVMVRGGARVGSVGSVGLEEFALRGAREKAVSPIELHIQYAAYKYDLVREN
jgi:hypothetical protein